MNDEDKIRLVEMNLDRVILSCEEDTPGCYCSGGPSNKIVSYNGRYVIPCVKHLSCYSGASRWNWKETK